MDDGARGLSELAKARLARQDGGGIAFDWSAYNAKKKAMAAKGVPWGQRVAALYGRDIRKAKTEDVHVSPDGSRVHIVTPPAQSPDDRSKWTPGEQHEFTRTKDGSWQHHTGQKADTAQAATINERLKKGDYTKN